MLMNHHDLFGRQSPVKVQSCILVRPNKGPSPPSPTWQSGQQILELACRISLMTSALVILTSES